MEHSPAWRQTHLQQTSCSHRSKEQIRGSKVGKKCTSRCYQPTTMKHAAGFGQAKKKVACICYNGSLGPKTHCQQHGSLSLIALILSFCTQRLRRRSVRCKCMQPKSVSKPLCVCYSCRPKVDQQVSTLRALSHHWATHIPSTLMLSAKRSASRAFSSPTWSFGRGAEAPSITLLQHSL